VCDSFSGTVTFTTGTGILAAGTILTVTINAVGHNRVNQANTVLSIQGGTTWLAPTWTNSTSALVISTGVALAPSTTYTISYVLGGQ
jgi:hypothetical protein